MVSIKRREPIVKMTDADLLDDLISYQRWAGDDFSIHPIPASEARRAEKVALEILRRMGGKRTTPGKP